MATQARRYVDALPAGSKTRITDTRKTTPGLRALERYAVRAGGAFNHRDNLGAAVLIKDNHIASCGGVRAAIERARTRAPHTAKIECEVDTLEQLDEALAARADIVLLDNMTTEQMAEAVRRAAGKALLEASGGMTLARIPEIAKAGVDAISVGAPHPLGARPRTSASTSNRPSLASCSAPRLSPICCAPASSSRSADSGPMSLALRPVGRPSSLPG